MNKKLKIVIIGTVPPCPRCDLLGVLVRDSLGADKSCTIAHCAYDSLPARMIAKNLGVNIGSAEQVADAAGIRIDWEHVRNLIGEKKSYLPKNSRPCAAWSQELDNALEPCRQAAESVGYLMTPVLLVNDQVVHHGSVPSRRQLKTLFAGVQNG